MFRCSSVSFNFSLDSYLVFFKRAKMIFVCTFYLTHNFFKTYNNNFKIVDIKNEPIFGFNQYCRGIELRQFWHTPGFSRVHSGTIRDKQRNQGCYWGRRWWDDRGKSIAARASEDQSDINVSMWFSFQLRSKLVQK